MKTTVELPDALLAEARRFADDHGMTMKALIEQGLRKAMATKTDKPFKLRDRSVGGSGLTPEFQNASWEQLRDAIYEGRGG